MDRPANEPFGADDTTLNSSAPIGTTLFFKKTPDFPLKPETSAKLAPPSRSTAASGAKSLLRGEQPILHIGIGSAFIRNRREDSSSEEDSLSEKVVRII
jgi:hypothetical protein